jgi:heat shock protein HslJ
MALKLNSKYLFLVFSIFFVLSCAEDKKNNEEAIENTQKLTSSSWMVIDLNGITSFTRNPSIHINLEQNKISGSTGCNKYFGSLTVENNMLTTKNIASTKMMCSDISIEDTFIKFINQTLYIEIKNDQLNLFDADGNLVIKCSPLVED